MSWDFSSNHIGVLRRQTDLNAIKQALFFFDQIAIPFLTICPFTFDDEPYGMKTKLIESGKIIDPIGALVNEDDYLTYEQEYQSTMLADIGLDADTVQRAVKQFSQLVRGKNLFDSEVEETAGHLLKENPKRLFHSALHVMSSEVRHLTSLLRSKNKINATPLYSSQKSFNNDYVEKGSDVIKIVIHNFPYPDLHKIPTDIIIEYKKESDVKYLSKKFRSWTNKISKNLNSSHEVMDELDYLLDEHVKINSLLTDKYQTAPIDIITTTVTAIENIIKLSPSQVMKDILSIETKSLDLTLEEQRAPGNEVAYLFHLDKFIQHGLEP